MLAFNTVTGSFVAHLGGILGVACLAALFTVAIKNRAARAGIVDAPGTARKIHGNRIPLLGGVAIFFALIIGIGVFWPQVTVNIGAFKIIAMLAGGLVLMIGGYFDDKKPRRPAFQIIFPILAAFIVVAAGIFPEKITNPLGGAFDLAMHLAMPMTFIWLMGLMYTTKFLDGIDGLATGVTAIGALVIVALALTPKFYQPDVALLAALLAAANLGFLFFNFHPASIFLGEGGSLFAGFMLGILAVISGGKIATTLLVMGLPIIDVAAVLATRLIRGARLTVGDSSHLHFRLLTCGFNQRHVVLLYYVVALSFGMTTLFLPSVYKMVTLAILGAAVIILIIGAVWKSEKF